MSNPTPPLDPNAPLEAFQRSLDEDHRYFNGPGDSFNQERELPSGGGHGNYRLGHMPTLDDQEGSSDE